MTRLRRADCSGPGITRKRAGSGFAYFDERRASTSTSARCSTRIRELGIPPAWKDVWICPYPNGHLQATGIDAAGRKQYRYHDAWRTRRDAEKFDDMTRFAHALPRLREQVEADLAATDQLTRERVLACAVRLLDRGFFRVGTEEYTESFGLATIRKSTCRIEDGQMVFDYPAKSGKRRIQGGRRPARAGHRVLAQAPPRRRAGAARVQDGPPWCDLRSDDINDYLKAEDRRRLLRQGLPDLERDRDRRARAGRLRPRARHQDLTQAGDHPRDQGDLALPRQHAGGVPRLLHRPARVRRLPRRARARPRGDRGGARRRARRRCPPTTRGSSGRCWT